MKAKVTCPRLAAMKGRGERITAITAYDYPMSALVDAAGIDVVLVGDSMGSVVLGYESTIPVTLEDITGAVRAVRRGLRRALLVADLPFGYASVATLERTVEASVRLLREGAEAVKLEGGTVRVPLVRALVDAEIPVMGHLGLTPQSIHSMGGYKVQGKSASEATRLLEDAVALETAGVFAVVLEGVPTETAAAITERLRVPTIGIGAGVRCDGQILVLHDLLGLTVPPAPTGPTVTRPRKPRFVREYANLRETIVDAVRHYAEDVRAGEFPSNAESYRLSEAEADRASVGG